jgi:hypothetical protein
MKIRMACSALLAALVAIALNTQPAFAERGALDTRAPDLNAPVATTVPEGVNELDLGLGLAFGPNAPMAAQLPVTPVPQATWLRGLSSRSDVLVGMFGPGPSLLGRYGIIPGRLNIEAGVQSYLFPVLVVAPIAELQFDVPVNSATLHLVSAVQPEFGGRQQLTAFGVAGLEWPVSPHWDLSASLKGTYASLAALDWSPAAGVRYTWNPHYALEATALMQAGAPAVLVYGGRRY